MRVRGLNGTGFWMLTGWTMVFAMTGCTTLGSGGELPSAGSEPAAQGTGRYAVEIHTGFGKPVVWEGTTTESTTVQTALEASGAFRRIRNPEVELLRNVPENRNTLKLFCSMQPGKQRVKYEQDYAVLPGDRLIVRPAAGGNPLTQIFGK